jgi:hypothetical protein
MVRKAGEIMRHRNPDKGFGLGFAKGATAFEIDVETGRRRGDKNIEWFSGGGQGTRNRVGSGHGPVHRRGKQRAGVDFNDLMRARLHEAGGWPPLDIARVKSCAATPGAMRIGEVRDLIRQAGPPQGALDQIAFPSRVRVRRKRLHRAAAAVREIATERRDPMRACGQNLDQYAARTIDFGGNCFASQGIGDKDQAIRALRDAFPARAEPVDGEPRHHCENWLPVFGRNRATACGEPADLAQPLSCLRRDHCVASRGVFRGDAGESFRQQ